MLNGGLKQPTNPNNSLCDDGTILHKVFESSLYFMDFLMINQEEL
jgi:hypothetical protein